jgi:hypothetical protein
MANKKISELQSRTPALSDLMLVGDPSSGYSYKCTVTALATIIETDIADGYVTIGTTQTISGAKTFSNNLTLTSVVNTPTDPDKFLTLNASNVVTYRTGAEVLSDIGGVGGSGTTNYLPKFTGTTTIGNSNFQTDANGNLGIGTSLSNWNNGYRAIQSNTTLIISSQVETDIGNNFYIDNTGNGYYLQNGGATIYQQYGSIHRWVTAPTGTAGNVATFTERMRLTPTGLAIGTDVPDATARVQINKTDGYGLYINYNTSTGSGVTTTALYAINTTASSGYAAVIEEKTPNGTLGQYPFVIKHSLSSGTAGVGFGTGVHFQLLDDAGTSKTTQLTIENIDAAAATYKTRYRFNVQNNGSSTPVVYINGTGLGVFTASPSVALDVTGEGKFSTINNATTDTDKFLVSDSGVIKYRTGAEVLSDIGGQAALTNPVTGTGTTTYLSKFTGSTSIGNSMITEGAANEVALEGTGTTGGSLNLKHYASFSGKGVGYSWIGVSSNNYWFQSQTASGTKSFYFDITNNTLNSVRQYIMPNASGTLALTSDITSAISGTTNYIPKFTSSSAIGNSIIYETGGLIGIGTTTPAEFVHLKTGSYGTPLYVEYTGGTSTYIGLGNSGGRGYLLSNNNDLVFATSSSATERMRLTSGGNLGLGISSPTSKLDVYQSSTTQTLMRIEIPNVAQLNIGNGGSSINYYDANTQIFRSGNGTERMRLDASGNLGLGTSSPTQKLNIASDGYNFRIANISNAQGYNIGRNVTDGLLYFYGDQSGANGYVFTGVNGERMRLNASGNLGLGVTPSAWESGFNVFQIGNTGVLANNTSDLRTILNSNAFNNTSGNTTYLANGFATSYMQISGTHRWLNAPSGTAGNAISFTQAMTLDASGRLGIGVTNPTYNLDLNSAGATTIRIAGAGEGYTQGALLLQSATTSSPQNRGLGIYTFNEGTDATWYFGNGYGYADAFVINRKAGTTYSIAAAAPAESSNLFTITSSGNVGISTTSPGYKLQVQGTQQDAVQTIARFAANNSSSQIKAFDINITAGTPLITLATAAVGTDAAMAFATAGSERMRITSGGELLINTTSDAGDYKLQVNGNTYGNGTAYFTGNMGIGVAPATDVLLYSTKALSGSVAPTGIFLGGLVSATSTTAAAYYITNATTENATFTLPHLYHYRAVQGTFGASSTVTNQYGFFVANSLTSATNNFAFYGDLAAATGRWNLYMNGTANNYLAGTLAIGTTSPNASALLDVSSTTKGFLPPRMTGAQAEAIATPAAGLMIYANNGNGTTITSTGWWGYDGTTWVKLN